MATQPPADVDPKQLKEAESLWHSFTVSMKWSIIACAVVLIVLALAFVPSGA